VRFPGWRKREEEKRKRQKLVDDIISDNEVRQKRAKDRSPALREGASELVKKYDQGRVGKKTFVYGYKIELAESGQNRPETIYGLEHPERYTKPEYSSRGGEYLLMFRGRKVERRDWDGKTHWPKNYRTSNHMILETKLGVTGIDNIGEEGNSVKQLLIELKQNLLELKFRKIAKEIFETVLSVTWEGKRSLKIEVKNKDEFRFSMKYTKLERSRESIAKEMLNDLKEIEERSIPLMEKRQREQDEERRRKQERQYREEKERERLRRQDHDADY